jgi:hypothetical protein
MARLIDMLNAIMEIDHVIQVIADGEIADGVKGVYAPNLYDDELDDTSWSLMDGYSRQDGYSGPVMHDSEYVNGQMARDILDTPGYYVAIPAYYSDDESDKYADDFITEGWAVAYKETI